MCEAPVVKFVLADPNGSEDVGINVNVTFEPPVHTWMFPFSGARPSTTPESVENAADATALWAALLKSSVKRALELPTSAWTDETRVELEAQVHEVLRVWVEQGKLQFPAPYGY